MDPAMDSQLFRFSSPHALFSTLPPCFPRLHSSFPPVLVVFPLLNRLHRNDDAHNDICLLDFLVFSEEGSASWNASFIAVPGRTQSVLSQQWSGPRRRPARRPFSSGCIYRHLCVHCGRSSLGFPTIPRMPGPSVTENIGCSLPPSRIMQAWPSGRTWV